MTHLGTRRRNKAQQGDMGATKKADTQFRSVAGSCGVLRCIAVHCAANCRVLRRIAADCDVLLGESAPRRLAVLRIATRSDLLRTGVRSCCGHCGALL